jgi:hypothetical protein
MREELREFYQWLRSTLAELLANPK